MSLYTFVNDSIQRLAVRSDETPHRMGRTKTFLDAKKPGQPGGGIRGDGSFSARRQRRDTAVPGTLD